MNNNLPTSEYLRERLAYEPETGRLFWRHHPSKSAHWNALYAGKEAFATQNGKGYLKGYLDYRQFQTHRVIWAMMHGEWPNGPIDHINHNGSDNRLENLRVVSAAENCRNRTLPKNSTSGVMGVFLNRKQNMWFAHIAIDGKRKHIGWFKTAEEAVAARRAAEREHGYHENHGTVRASA